MTRANTWVIRLCLALTVLHLAAAATLTHWPRLLSHGWFDTRLSEPVRDATLWFTFGGIALAAIVSLARLGIRTTGVMPTPVGVYLLLLGVPLTVFQPVSGGVGVVIAGLAALTVARRAARTGQSSLGGGPSRG